MASEEQNATPGEEAAPETPDETTDAPPPAMNRAQRRAMAKGKKDASGTFNPASPQARNARGSHDHAANRHGQSHFPRTGHK